MLSDALFFILHSSVLTAAVLFSHSMGLCRLLLVPMCSHLSVCIMHLGKVLVSIIMLVMWHTQLSDHRFHVLLFFYYICILFIQNATMPSRTFTSDTDRHSTQGWVGGRVLASEATSERNTQPVSVSAPHLFHLSYKGNLYFVTTVLVTGTCNHNINLLLPDCVQVFYAKNTIQKVSKWHGSKEMVCQTNT